MKCPYCKKNIKKVWVVSESSQPCNLDGKEIEGYGRAEVGKTIRIECWECNSTITDLIRRIGGSYGKAY